MWNKTVTLYIDDGSIRLLVMQGQRIKKWADNKLEAGLITDGVVIQEKEVAARIKQLLKSQKVRTKKVVLGFSGLHSLTRPATLPRLPKSMLSEAVIREARRVLPVPLEQLYLSWQNLPCRRERIQVFMVAIPRKTADSLVKTLKVAGLQPTRMAIKPLILTKALSLNTSILIDLQPGEFDIAILSEGIAQPIRTVTLPNVELTWEQKINTVANDLSRTIKFFDSNNPEKTLQASVPIFVSGELIHKPQFQKALSDITGHPVYELVPLVKSPPRLDLGYYMVNISMALRPVASIREATYPIANLNVMPAPYLPKPISLTKVTGIPGGIALAGLIVPFIMLMQNTSINISSMENQLEVTNQVIIQKNAQRLELKKTVGDLEKKANAAKLAYEKIRKPMENIRSNQEMLNGDLLITLNNLSEKVALTDISESNGILLVKGQAPSEKEIYGYAQAIIQYARSLDQSKRFTESTISSISVIDSNSAQLKDGIPDLGLKTTKIEFVLTFQRGKK